MASAAELVLLLKSDASGIESGMGKARGMVGGLVDSLGKLGLAGMGIGVVTGAVEAAVGSFGGLVSAAEAVGDAQARVNLVFGEGSQLSRGIAADAAEQANALGLTREAYISSVGALGQLATSLGVGQKASADMAQGIAELAPKLAAYAGVEGQVASDALEKALLGKTKGLAALGIAITDADQKAAALSLGIGGEPAKWTEAQIAQVNYAAAMAKTGAAQAAWADNQGDVEVSMQRVSAAIDDAKAALGEKLLPVLAPLAEQFASVLPGAIDAAMSVLGPFLDRAGEVASVLGSTVGPAMEILKAAFADDWSQAATDSLMKLNDLFGNQIGNGIMQAASAIGNFGGAIQAAFGGDASGALDSLGGSLFNLIESIGLLTGIDTTAIQDFLFGAAEDSGGGAWDTLASAMLTALDVGGQVLTWIDETVQSLGGWTTVIAAVATGLAAFSIISTVIGWVTGLLAAWASLGAGITAAGGIVGAIVAVLGGPLTIAIGAVAAIIALLAAAWINDWGGMQGKVAEVVGWIQANVVPAIQSAFGAVQAILSNLVAWWQENGAQVIAVVSGIVTFVVEQFQFLFNIISGIVKAGIALITGDWAGLGEAVGSIIGNLVSSWVHMFQGIISAVVAVFRGLWPAVKSAVSAGVAGVISWLKGEGEKMGSMTLQGLIDGIKSGAGRVLQALKDLASGMVKGFMDSLVMHSPSQLFVALGEFITIGLAMGIQKADQKAIEALANVVSKITSVATGLADFGKKLADMIVPTDSQISAAKEKYVRMTLILTDFIKSISYLGSLLPVSSMGQAGPGQIKTINAGLIQLSQAFPAIKELQGLGAENLLTGGEADWASRLSDMVGKIAGVWGGLADNMTKMASAVFPSDAQLQQLKESTIRIALWAADSLKNPTLPSVGAAEFAASMKSITDALSTVAGLNLSGIVVVADRELQTAGASLTSLATWAREMIVDWLVIMPDQKARAEFVAQLQEFAGLIKAAADIVKSADIGDLSKMVVLQVSDFGPVKDSLGRMQQLTTEIVQAWAKGAGDAAARAQWITDLKDFAATMGAAADILKISAIGEIDATLTVNIDAVRSVLSSIRDDLAPMIQELADEWARVNTEGDKATARMALFGGWLKAALDIAKATVVGELEASILVNKDIMLRILVWLRDDFAPAIQGISDAWVMAEKDAAAATEKMKSFSGWLGAAVDIAKASVIGELHANVLVNGETMKAILVWLRDDFVPAIQEIADGWSMSDKAGGEAAARMKAFADWVRAATDIAKSTVVGELHANILVNTEVMKAILVWLRDSFVPAIQEIADGWGETAKSAAPIVEKMNAFASVIKAATDIAKASDVGDLASATSTSDLEGRLRIIKANVLAVYNILGEIAQDITASEAEYRARIASAVGDIGKSFGDFGGGIGGIMELVESRLFGSDPTQSGLGHTQRTKGNRADFFASQIRDTIVRAVKAVQDALSGLSLVPDDPKVKALGQLGDAFSKLSGALTELATAKMPDARQLAAVLAATAALSGATALPGTAPGAGTGTGGGASGTGSLVTGDTINLYGNVVVVAETDDPKGLVEALKLALI